MALTSSDGVREGWGAEKSRVVTWRDPAPTAAIAASMDGWEFVEAIMDHRLPSPPIQQLMQFELVSVEPGRTVFTCAPDECAYNAIGAVCGGLVCALLDTAVGSALHSAMPKGKGFTSVEIKVNFLKAVRHSSGVLTATGTVVKSGSRVAVLPDDAVPSEGRSRSPFGLVVSVIARPSFGPP